MKFLSKISVVLLLVSISASLSARNSIPTTEKSTVNFANLVLPTATISGTTTVCQNAASPVITFTGIGGTAPFTFTYNINGGAPQTVTTVGSNSTVTVTVNTSVATTLTYNLINVIDSLSPIQSASGNAIITIKPSPDAMMGGTGSGSIFNGVPVFRVCSNTVSSFNFTNTSSTPALNTNYTINWGDASPNYVAASWTTTSHTYAIGLWNLVYTIQGNNGCNTTKNYIVFVGSNPAVSLGNPGNTDICNSSSLTFPITGTTNNPPGTTYTVTFNDGSTPQVFNHPPPSSVTHSFLVSSCGVTSSDGSNSYPNSFSANIVATNPCNTSSVGVVPIYVSTPPDANFTIPVTACINTQVCMTNTSIGAFENNGSSAPCTTSPKIIWSISPGTGFIINSGSLGNDFSSTDPGLWLSGSNALCLSFSQVGTYTITIKTGNRCGFDTETNTICIEAPLVPLFSLSNNAGCTPLTVNASNTTNLTTSCTATSFLWAVSYVAGNCGNSSIGWSYSGGTNQNSANPTFNFITPGTYNIRLTATNSCGAITSSIQTVTVKKPPTASINAIPNFCGSATITPSAVVDGCAPASSVLTYAWSFPGGSPSSSSAVSPGTVNYSATGNYTVSLTVTNECGVSTTATEAFLVSISPTITNTTLGQTICSGTQTSLVTINADTSGTSFSWAAIATSGITGFTTSGNTDIIPVQTLTTTNTSPGTVTYTITPSIGSCVGTAFQYVITINPAPTFTSQPIGNTACQGALLVPLTIAITSAGGSPLYQWYSNTVSNTTSGTLITGETNAIYAPPSSAIGTLYYYCVITLSSGGCASLTSATAAVTISPTATITLQPLATQNICVGVTIPSPLTVNFSGGTGAASYQWFSNTSNSTVGGTAIAGAINASYTPAVFTSAGTFYYYVVLTLSGNGCGTTTSTVAAVNVSADPTITSQPNASQTLCQGTTPVTLSVTAVGGLGTFSYQWYATPTTSIPSATGSTFVPNTNIVGTTNYYCIVSQPGLGCEVTSANAQVVVVPAPTISSQPQSSAICIGGVPNPLSVAYTNGTGTASYQWYDGAGLILGATNATFTPTLTATTSYYCIITFSSGGCTNITSNTAVITVEPLPTIDFQPLITQNICVGGVIPPLTVSYLNGAGTPTYQWYSNSSSSTTGGTPVGTNSASFSPPVFNTAGTFYYYATVSLSGNGCGTATSNSSEVIVVADPILNTQPFATQTLCQGTTPTTLAVTASGGLGVFSYQWYSNSPPSTLLAGATNDTYIPDTSVPGTTSYYCVVSQLGLGCEVVSNLAEVIVVPAPLFTMQPQNRAVCEGGTVAPINVAYSNGTGVASYQWYSNSTNSNSGGAMNIGAITDTFNPPSANVGTVYYYCEITFSSGGCTLITSNTAEVNIFQFPVIVAQNVVTCSGDLLNFVPQPGSGNTVPSNTLYTWNLISINPLGSVTGTTNETVPQSGLFQTLVNSTNQVATVTYSVTPIAGICIGNSFTVEVLVYPKPAVIFDIADQTICNGTNSSLVTLSSSTPGTITFNWTATVPLGISGAILSGTDLIPVQTLVNSTTLPLTVTYSSIGTFNYNSVGCNGPTSVYSITVNPTIISSGTTSNYNGYGVSFFGATDGSIDLTVTGGSGIYTYTWSGPNGFSATTEDLNGIPAGTYSVIIDDGFCTPTILTFTLTQPPELLFQENVAVHVDLICFGDNNGVLGITITQESVPPYDFQLINSSGNVVITILNDTGLNQVFTGLVADTYSVKIIDANGGVKILNGIIITQPNDIVITAATTPITCYGANNASITLTVSGGTGPYTAQWDNFATGFFQDNLSAATYTILVTDSNNCTKSISVVIPEALLFTVNPIVKNVSCFGANDGSINLNFVGGIPAITLAWSDGSTSGTTRNNLGPGTYSVTIIDGTPCTIARTFTIVEPQPMVVGANLTDALDCNDANSGGINLLVSGGTPPFTYTWSNGATTEDLSAITGGNYFVTVTDANGCTQTGQYVISRPAPIFIAITTNTNFNCDTRYVYQDFTAQASGGIPPYQL